MLGCWEEGTYGRTYVKYVHTYVIDYRFYPVESERGYLRTYLLTYLLTYAHPYVRTRMNVRTCVSRLWPNGLGLTALAFCPATASLARLSQTTDPRLNVRLNVRLTGDHPPSQITPDGTRIIFTYVRTDVSTQPCSKLLGNFPLSPLSCADHAMLFFSIHVLSL